MATAAARTDHAALFTNAARLAWSDVPTELRAHIVRVFADTVGVIAAGGLEREIIGLARGSAVFGSDHGASTMLVEGFPRASSARAAFVNGTAGTFLELDEACPPASHPAIHVLPAALAAAQALGSSGRALLTSFAAGYEVVARLFDAYQLPYPVHPHGHIGAVGAAVAVAMLRGADAVEPASIASSSPILATWDACHEGATVRNAWAGLANEAGVRANILAEAGFTGSRTALETGFGRLIGELKDADALTRELDPARLRIADNYFKFHSACAGAHPALDATLALGPIRAADVRHVLVELPPQNWKLDAPSRGNDLANRFSIPYAVAAAIVHGHTGPAAFRPDSRVEVLSARVAIRHAADLDTPYPPTRMPARVTIELRDRTVTQGVEYPYGHSANPASPERLRAKFEQIAPRAVVAMYDDLMRLADLRNVRDLFVSASVAA